MPFLGSGNVVEKHFGIRLARILKLLTTELRIVLELKLPGGKISKTLEQM